MTRLLFNVAVLVSVILFPAWVTLLVMCTMLIVVRGHLVEVVLWGCILDVIGGVYLHGFPYLPIFYTILSGGLFVAMELLKPHLVFYESSR